MQVQRDEQSRSLGILHHGKYVKTQINGINEESWQSETVRQNKIRPSVGTPIQEHHPVTSRRNISTTRLALTICSGKYTFFRRARRADLTVI